jgi:hypothetical protein
MSLNWRATGQRLLRGLALAFALSALGGCASFYVDGNAPEVPAAQFKKPPAPAPVQLVFEFQTKGVPNARATAFLKAKVTEQAQASGLFSQVSEAPVSGGALLSITLNNIPLSDDAFAKGFVAGLTFGLAGQVVGDGYDCTVRYVSGKPGAQAVTKQGKHVIYTGVGNAGPPANAIKVPTVDEAVFTMVRQVISRTLNDMSQDPRFP